MVICLLYDLISAKQSFHTDILCRIAPEGRSGRGWPSQNPNLNTEHIPQEIEWSWYRTIAMAGWICGSVSRWNRCQVWNVNGKGVEYDPAQAFALQEILVDDRPTFDEVWFSVYDNINAAENFLSLYQPYHTRWLPSQLSATFILFGSNPFLIRSSTFNPSSHHTLRQ